MKRALGSSCAILAFGWLVSSSAQAEGLRVVSSSEREVVVEWTASEVAWESVSGESAMFRRPTVPGGAYLAAPGEADVPSIVHLVAVPAEGTPQIQVSEIVSDAISAPDLAPAPEERIDVDEGGRVDVHSTRTRLAPRSTESMTPAAWAELGGISQVRGNRLARVVLHPYRFDAARKELHAARRLVVRIDVGTGAGAAPRGRPESREWEDALRGSVLNPDGVRAFRTAPDAPVTRGGGDSFASSSNWLKVKLESSGLYQIDYFTFTNLGYDPGSIDPTTIRVFSGRFLPVAENLNIPRDSFMTEHALLDLGDGDTVFETDDRLFFYALGPNGWAAEYDSTLSRTLHLENQYSNQTVVWITWGGSFSSPTARRMTSRSVAPDTTATFSTFAPHREHFEQNNIDNYRFRDEDGWWWESLRGRGNDRRYDLKLEGVANGNGRVLARIGSVDGTEDYRRVQLKLGQQVIADSTWRHSSQSALVDLEGQSSGSLYDGTNSVVLNVIRQSTPVETTDQVQLAWFEIEYQRRLEARGGRMLHFFADSARGVSDHELSGFQGDSSSVFLFDVTDPHAPVRLQNFALTDSTPPHGIRFSDPLPNGTTRWYLATTPEGVLSLPRPEVASIKGLHTPANGGEYIVLYHPRFERVAQRLAQLRATAPRHPRSTKLVSIEDVYDEFSWGMVDPTAMRDLFVYAIQNWSQDAPVYAVLVGDAAYDQKRYLAGSPENLVPSYLNRYRESTVRLSPVENTYFYSTDDFFGYLEPADYQQFIQPGLDLAIGRYPISDEATMDIMLDKLEAYLAETQSGSWQNRAIMVADDERTLDEFLREPYHTTQVDAVARGWMPPSLDLVKIYLTEFPRNDFGKKPDAQAKFIEEFTRGALMVSYTGHGDQNTMAQEEVFVSQKIPELLNEEKYPIFSTFSCTVSRFDLLSGSSMCELFLTHPGGGAVTTFSSGSLVFPNPSWVLHQRWIGSMFGTPYFSGSYARQVMPLGVAALIAKVITSDNYSTRSNNEKYVLLGDPALELRFGKSAIAFDHSTVATQTTDGNLRLIRGSVVDAHGAVMDGTNGAPPFSGKGFVYVTENADTSGYQYEYPRRNIDGTITMIPDSIAYVLEGPIAYRGEVPIENGRFEAKFFLSAAVPTGNRARVSVFALEEGMGRDGSGAFDSLAIAPTITPEQVSDALGPSIEIGFEGFDGFAEGDFLKTDRPVAKIGLDDPSGINLRLFPQFARLEMEIDGSERLDLAQDFSYIEGSYTQGQVRRVLSLAPGEHTIEVKAFDNVGNRSSTKTRFTIVTGEADFDLVDAEITPYPNPFQDEVHFVFRLTRDADVALRVYTISGRRIFSDEAIAGRAGENVYAWDGRDEGGGLLANGTYLYKLDAAFRNTDGNLEKDEFVGRVVKMR